MGFLNKLFGGTKTKSNSPKGFEQLMVREIRPLSKETVEILFEIPNTVKPKYDFIPGQYVNIHVEINGEVYRRSYSICSKPGEPLAIAVKKVEKGIVSNYLNKDIAQGSYLWVSSPDGHFVVTSEKKIVAIAAGSGITPIMSIAKSLEGIEGADIQLFYGSKTAESVLFKEELKGFNTTKTTYFFTKESVPNTQSGRVSKDAFTEIIKGNLPLLKSDGFYICGPEDLIFGIKEVLELFGVNKDKIHFELFTPPTAPEHISSTVDVTEKYSGESQVTAVLDGEEFKFKLQGEGKSILDQLMKEGADAPYSCRGGVCSSCKAKVTEGSVKMDLNYSLTDREVEEGYILTCQAHPTSEKVKITYDV